IQIVMRARQAGLGVTVRDLFQHQTVAELALELTGRGGEREREAAPQGAVSGKLEWTPIQEWFWEQGRRHPHHYNQAVLLEPRGLLDTRKLRRAVSAVLAQHDMLRLRVRDGQGWLEGDARPTVLAGIDLRGTGWSKWEETLAAVQGSLNLESGPVTR